MNAFLSIAALLFLPVVAADVQPSNGKLAKFFDPQQAAIKIDASGLHVDLRGRALATGNKDDAVAAPRKKGGTKASASTGKKGTTSVKKDKQKKGSEKEGGSGKKSKGKKTDAGDSTGLDNGVPPPLDDGPLDDGRLEPGNFQTEFAMIRSQVDSPDAVYSLASSIGINGFITEIIYTADGSRTVGNEAIGQFKGACTMISEVSGSLMCSYEIVLTQNQTGVIITTGKVVMGEENKAIVTGAEFDFAGYNGGVLTTMQDEDKPVFYAHLSLF